MALRLIRGFDHETSLTDLLTGGVFLTGGSSNFGFTTGRFGGKALIAPYGGGINFPIPSVASDSSVYVGCALQIPNSNFVTLVSAVDGQARIQAYVAMSSGGIGIYRTASNQGHGNTNNDTLLASLSTTEFTGAWLYIEVEFIIHPTAGEIHVRVGGASTEYAGGDQHEHDGRHDLRIRSDHSYLRGRESGSQFWLDR